MKKYDDLTFQQYCTMSQEEKEKITKVQLMAMFDRHSNEMLKTAEDIRPSVVEQESEPPIIDDSLDSQEEIQDEGEDIKEEVKENQLALIPNEMANALVTLAKQTGLRISDFAKENPGASALVAAATGGLIATGFSSGVFQELASKANPFSIIGDALKSLSSGDETAKKNLRLPLNGITYDNGKKGIPIPRSIVLPDREQVRDMGGQAELLTNDQIDQIRESILDKKCEEAAKQGEVYEICTPGEYSGTPYGYKKFSVTEMITCPDGSSRKIVLGYRFKKV